jgi:hypothetical protein
MGFREDLYAYVNNPNNWKARKNIIVFLTKTVKEIGSAAVAEKGAGSGADDMMPLMVEKLRTIVGDHFENPKKAAEIVLNQLERDPTTKEDPIIDILGIGGLYGALGEIHLVQLASGSHSIENPTVGDFFFVYGCARDISSRFIDQFTGKEEQVVWSIEALNQCMQDVFKAESGEVIIDLFEKIQDEAICSLVCLVYKATQTHCTTKPDLAIHNIRLQIHNLLLLDALTAKKCENINVKELISIIASYVQAPDSPIVDHELGIIVEIEAALTCYKQITRTIPLTYNELGKMVYSIDESIKIIYDNMEKNLFAPEQLELRKKALIQYPNIVTFFNKIINDCDPQSEVYSFLTSQIELFQELNKMHALSQIFIGTIITEVSTAKKYAQQQETLSHCDALRAVFKLTYDEIMRSQQQVEKLKNDACGLQTRLYAWLQEAMPKPQVQEDNNSSSKKSYSFFKKIVQTIAPQQNDVILNLVEGFWALQKDGYRKYGVALSQQFESYLEENHIKKNADILKVIQMMQYMEKELYFNYDLLFISQSNSSAGIPQKSQRGCR